MLKIKPSDVGVELEKVGVSSANRPEANEVPLRVLDPVGAPVFVAIMVAMDEVFGARPVTLPKPELFMVTMPPFVAVPDQV
jgi:hypothetical protein